MFSQKLYTTRNSMILAAAFLFSTHALADTTKITSSFTTEGKSNNFKVSTDDEVTVEGIVTVSNQSQCDLDAYKNLQIIFTVHGSNKKVRTQEYPFPSESTVVDPLKFAISTTFTAKLTGFHYIIVRPTLALSGKPTKPCTFQQDITVTYPDQPPSE